KKRTSTYNLANPRRVWLIAESDKKSERFDAVHLVRLGGHNQREAYRSALLLPIGRLQEIEAPSDPMQTETARARGLQLNVSVCAADLLRVPQGRRGNRG